jgi:glycosyltransferase involved in cell wall biosynthesis
MGTHTLPLPFLRAGETHSLLLDSTWDLARWNSVEGKPKSDRQAHAFEVMERAAYAQIQNFFPVSNYVSENLIAHYGRGPQHIHVVGTGLGRIQAYDGPKDYTRPHLLFTAKGRFLDKGGPMVVEAFDIARKRLPQLRLTIVGSDKGRDFVTNPAIDVHGFVPLETLQKHFEESSLFVLPAPYEPWGLVYLEAMACGMPIIGLDRNAFPEFCSGERHGWTLRQADPLHLADLLVEAFAAPDLLEKKGRAARDFVGQRYSWRKTAERITRVLQNHL